MDLRGQFGLKAILWVTFVGAMCAYCARLHLQMEASQKQTAEAMDKLKADLQEELQVEKTMRLQARAAERQALAMKVKAQHDAEVAHQACVQQMRVLAKELERVAQELEALKRKAAKE